MLATARRIPRIDREMREARDHDPVVPGVALIAPIRISLFRMRNKIADESRKRAKTQPVGGLFHSTC